MFTLPPLPPLPDPAALIASLLPPGTPIQTQIDLIPGSSIGLGSVTIGS